MQHVESSSKLQNFRKKRTSEHDFSCDVLLLSPRNENAIKMKSADFSLGHHLYIQGISKNDIKINYNVVKIFQHSVIDMLITCQQHFQLSILVHMDVGNGLDLGIT